MREEIREREEEDNERCVLWRVILQLYGKKLICVDGLKYGQGRLLMSMVCFATKLYILGK